MQRSGAARHGDGFQHLCPAVLHVRVSARAPLASWNPLATDPEGGAWTDGNEISFGNLEVPGYLTGDCSEL